MMTQFGARLCLSLFDVNVPYHSLSGLATLYFCSRLCAVVSKIYDERMSLAVQDHNAV